ncbi:MAG: hypothetical protein F4X36_08800 [Gammaproteobacteria bacterium]|nr:hypothetical protein [Gammaproteobacteria bacterium]
MKPGKCLTALAMALLAGGAWAQEDMMVPLFMSASDPYRQGFVRLINHSKAEGTVVVRAIDDEGRSYRIETIPLKEYQTLHFNSDDLELGNDAKGLRGTGSGQGDWRLEVSDGGLDLEVLAYIRTVDGFLTSMHDLVTSLGGLHRVPIFNPGSNTAQESRLRLINPGDEDATITIKGVDDAGVVSDEVELKLDAGTAKTFTAAQLEAGEMMAFTGALGDGEGKWQLFVESDESIQVMSLMSTPTGHLTNLATTDRPALASDISGEGIEFIQEFSLGAENTFPTGITFFQNRFYVLNYSGTVYAYTETGEREPAADIELTYRPLPAFGAQPANRAVGLGVRADRFYVHHEERIRAFTLSGAEDPDATFDLALGHTVRDMAIGPERFYFVGSRGFGSATEVLVYDFEHKFQDAESFLKGADSAEPLAIGFDPKARFLYVINEDHDGAINAFTLKGEHRAGLVVPFSGVDNVGTATIIGDAIYVLDELANKVYGFRLRGSR